MKPGCDEKFHLQSGRSANDRHPADDKLAVHDNSVRNAYDVESRPAVFDPSICQFVEFLRIAFEHLSRDDKTRAGLLPSHKILNHDRATLNFKSIVSKVRNAKFAGRHCASRMTPFTVRLTMLSSP